MNTASKKSLHAALMTVSVVLGTWALQPALADTKPAGMMAGGGMQGMEQCPMMGAGDYGKHMRQKLDELGTNLHLKDNQQAAWKEYRDYLTQASTDQQKRFEEMRGPDARTKMRDLPAPERLQKMADRMKIAADELDKLAKHTATFYKTLSPEQKTIFDLNQRNMHPRKYMQHSGM